MTKKKTDYELLHGDSDDFTELYKRYSSGIRGFLFLNKLVNNNSDFPDILQITWLRAYQKRDMYDPQWAFSTWLSQIALHVAFNFYRDQAVLILTTNANFEEHIDPREPQDTAVIAETCVRVREAVNDLPENAREAIEKVYFSNMRFATAEYHQGYKRGRRLLRKSLGDMQNELHETVEMNRDESTTHKTTLSQYSRETLRYLDRVTVIRQERRCQTKTTI